MKWNNYPALTPPDVPQNETFGMDYEVKFRLPNGATNTTITEWLYEKQWNCIYPVIAWRKYNAVIPFQKKFKAL